MADNQFPADPQVDAALSSAGNPDVNDAFAHAADAPAQVTPEVAAPKAAAAPSSEPVNVFDPTGKLVSLPQSQLFDAVNAGYRPATTEEVDNHFKQEQYGGIGQQILTGLEGAADTTTFGTAGELEDIATDLGAKGVSGADRLARREANPFARLAGEVAGLAGSSFIPGIGEAGLLQDAGTGVAKAVGLGAPQTVASKIGAGAVKMAVENAMVQGGDEVSRMIAQDPNQTAQTALTDIGLSSLIGGVLGGGASSISPLWHAAMGSKLGSMLQSISDRVGGIEGVVPDSVNDAIQTVGIKVSPEVKAALSQDPKLSHMFQTLQESATGSGLKAQEALKTFKNDASNALVNAVGKTPEEVANLSTMSDFDAGSDVKNSIIKQLKETIDPISQQFEAVKSKFKSTELPTEAKSDIGTKVSELASGEGYNLSPSAPQAKLINRVLEELPNVKTLEDLRRYTSVIGDNSNTPELWRVGKQLKTIFRDAEEKSLTNAIGTEAPELLEQHAQARGAYKNAMDTVDNLNDRLHVGRFGGPSSFISALKDMAPEDVLRRLSPKGDAGIIGELSGKFPEAANQIKDYHLSQALKAAGSRAAPGEAINSRVFLSALEKMSPEMRSFIIPEGAGPKVAAIKSLLDGLPAKMNNSGTAKTLDSLWQHIPESAAAIVTMICGHNPATAYVVGKLTKVLGRDAPDAARLTTLRWLGTDKSIDAGAFKTAFDYIHSAIKGQNTLGKATKNIFKAGAEVLPQSMMPSEGDRKKLDKQVVALQQNPNPLMNGDHPLGHYMPEHNQAMNQTAVQAFQYLNQMRPNTDPKNALDTKFPPNKAAQADYNRILDVAQQPLVVMGRIKDGSLNSKDVLALQHMYPDLYQKLSGEIMNNIVEQQDKGNSIPYQTRQALSLFLAKPLDSTMVPQNIMAAQPQPPQGQPQTATQPASNPKSSTKGLSKLPTMYQTASQSAEANRAKH